jgi:hypothetical protein
MISARKFVEIGPVTQDWFARGKGQARGSAHERNQLAPLKEPLVISKVESVHPQFMPVRVVQGEGCEIVLDLASQTVGNTLQDLGQVEMGDDRVIDFEQDPSAFGGKAAPGRLAVNDVG